MRWIMVGLYVTGACIWCSYGWYRQHLTDMRGIRNEGGWIAAALIGAIIWPLAILVTVSYQYLCARFAREQQRLKLLEEEAAETARLLKQEGL